MMRMVTNNAGSLSFVTGLVMMPLSMLRTSQSDNFGRAVRSASERVTLSCRCPAIGA